MNINIFEKTKQSDLHTGDESSLADEHALHIKQKIEARKNKQKKIKLLLGGLILIIILLSTLTAYSQYKLYILSKDEIGATSNIPKTGEEVVTALGRHILLPSGTPQIAEVQDASRLRDTQAFFKDAQNGDIVVVYETTIFVYRPSVDIVVAAGDISGAGQIKP